MTVIGITGPTGAGKTTVLDVLRDMGGAVADCDGVYHALLRTSAPLREELRSRFGGEIFDNAGNLRRKALGAVVFGDQAALAEAMGTGKLWGAALDVTTPEPLPAGSPLWELPNLLLTPHVAGGMRLEITRRRCVEMAQENLRRYLAGEKLENVVKL